MLPENQFFHNIIPGGPVTIDHLRRENPNGLNLYSEKLNSRRLAGIRQIYRYHLGTHRISQLADTISTQLSSEKQKISLIFVPR